MGIFGLKINHLATLTVDRSWSGLCAPKYLKSKKEK
jgi:hypothetical protein